jgi:hypothetical protein
MLRHAFSTRGRKVAAVIVTVLLSAGTALAAWFLYTGLSGSIGGRAGTAEATVDALTFVANPAAAGAITPGSTVAGGFDVTNNASVTETISTVTAGAVTSNTAGCASHVTFNSTALVGSSFSANQVDATLPSSCQSATFAVPLSGTTNP